MGRNVAALRMAIVGALMVGASLAYSIGWGLGAQARPQETTLYVDYGTLVEP